MSNARVSLIPICTKSLFKGLCPIGLWHGDASPTPLSRTFRLLGILNSSPLPYHAGNLHHSRPQRFRTVRFCTTRCFIQVVSTIRLCSGSNALTICAYRNVLVVVLWQPTPKVSYRRPAWATPCNHCNQWLSTTIVERLIGKCCCLTLLGILNSSCHPISACGAFYFYAILLRTRSLTDLPCVPDTISKCT